MCVWVCYLEQQLVFSDALDGFDEVRGDGVGQPVSLLNLLSIKDISSPPLLADTNTAPPTSASF